MFSCLFFVFCCFYPAGIIDNQVFLIFIGKRSNGFILCCSLPYEIAVYFWCHWEHQRKGSLCKGTSLSLPPSPLPLPCFLLHFLFHSLIPLASSSPFHTLFSFPSPPFPFPFMPPFLSFDASYFLLYFLLHSFVPLTSSPPFSRSFLFTFPFIMRIFICFSNSLFSRSCPPLYPLPIALLCFFVLLCQGTCQGKIKNRW